jgi:hypothetical protein
VLGSGGAVGLDDTKAVEAPRKGGAVVEQAERSADRSDVDLADLAVDVPRDEVYLGLDERDDLRPEPKLGGKA